MNTIQIENGNATIASEKELLEDFLNSLELENCELTNIESPEIRLNNFLWLIKQKEEELNKCRNIACESITRTNAWLDLKEQRINNAIQYLTNQMGNYLKIQNLKSLSLPNGIIGLRKLPDIVNVINEEVFLLKAKPELLKHHPESFEPNLNAIKKYIKDTSEIPEGIDVVEQERKFYYKLSEI